MLTVGKQKREKICRSGGIGTWHRSTLVFNVRLRHVWLFAREERPIPFKIGSRKGQRKLSVFPPLFNFQTGGIVCIGQNSSPGVLNFAFFPPLLLSFLFSFFLFLSTVATENVFRRKFKILFFFFDGFINFRSNDWKRSWKAGWINRRVGLRWIFNLHGWRILFRMMEMYVYFIVRFFLKSFLNKLDGKIFGEEFKFKSLTIWRLMKWY